MSSQNSVPLKEFLEGRTQPDVAAVIGVTQGSISQMINSSRKIYVKHLPDGTYQAYEVKPIGKKTERRTAP